MIQALVAQYKEAGDDCMQLFSVLVSSGRLRVKWGTDQEPWVQGEIK